MQLARVKVFFLFPLFFICDWEFDDDILLCISDVATPSQAWETFEKSFSRKNTHRLKLFSLRKRLETLSKDHIRIFPSHEKVLVGSWKQDYGYRKRLLINGLRQEQEYKAYVAALAKQPSVDELDNFLISHEITLVKTANFKIEDKEETMFSKDEKTKRQGKSKSKRGKGKAKNGVDSKGHAEKKSQENRSLCSKFHN